MLSRRNNQDVGLEAAIIERVRNSSLVEWLCADNVPGLKPATEAVVLPLPAEGGRGAFRSAEKAQARAALERTEVRMPA